MTSSSGTATVIVPTHKGAGRIGALLDSLRAQTVPCEVIVVDNGSSDGTDQMLAGYPEVEVVRLERNVGFGPGLPGRSGLAMRR